MPQKIRKDIKKRFTKKKEKDLKLLLDFSKENPKQTLRKKHNFSKSKKLNKLESKLSVLKDQLENAEVEIVEINKQSWSLEQQIQNNEILLAQHQKSISDKASTLQDSIAKSNHLKQTSDSVSERLRAEDKKHSELEAHIQYERSNSELLKKKIKEDQAEFAQIKLAIKEKSKIVQELKIEIRFLTHIIATHQKVEIELKQELDELNLELAALEAEQIERISKNETLEKSLQSLTTQLNKKRAEQRKHTQRLVREESKLREVESFYSSESKILRKKLDKSSLESAKVYKQLKSTQYESSSLQFKIDQKKKQLDNFTSQSHKRQSEIFELSIKNTSTRKQLKDLEEKVLEQFKDHKRIVNRYNEQVKANAEQAQRVKFYLNELNELNNTKHKCLQQLTLINKHNQDLANNQIALESKILKQTKQIHGLKIELQDGLAKNQDLSHKVKADSISTQRLQNEIDSLKEKLRAQQVENKGLKATKVEKTALLYSLGMEKKSLDKKLLTEENLNLELKKQIADLDQEIRTRKSKNLENSPIKVAKDLISPTSAYYSEAMTAKNESIRLYNSIIELDAVSSLNAKIHLSDDLLYTEYILDLEKSQSDSDIKNLCYYIQSNAKQKVIFNTEKSKNKTRLLFTMVKELPVYIENIRSRPIARL